MITTATLKTKFPKLASVGLGTFALLLAGLSLAQNVVAPANLEQTASALPVEEANLALAETKPNANTAVAPADVEQTAVKSSSSSVVEDYTDKIGSGLKERERRLTLLNEAMMKLREAGEMEDAARVEERIRALLAMPAPSQVNSQLTTELEQLRAKNDELIVQMVAMEEELKRFRGTSAPNSALTRRR